VLIEWPNGHEACINRLSRIRASPSSPRSGAIAPQSKEGAKIRSFPARLAFRYCDTPSSNESGRMMIGGRKSGRDDGSQRGVGFHR
jgi:hypothetical protein